MNRTELILKLRDKLPQHEAKLIEKGVKNILYSITSTLANGGRVEIRDFGVFTTKQQPQRSSRNPKTGEIVTVPAKRKLHFKPGKELRVKVNNERS
jgi:integration host factor subunit beta